MQSIFRFYSSRMQSPIHRRNLITSTSTSTTTTTSSEKPCKTSFNIRARHIRARHNRDRKGHTMALSSSSTSSSDISTSSFKTWPVPMVESRGDYREEAHLEQLIHGPLYSSQGTLPRLPIPSINETISTFLPTALPLAETEEEADKLKEACEAFPIQAAKLHNRLESGKNEMDSNSSWLQLWWNTEGYLKSKDSECCQRLFAL